MRSNPPQHPRSSNTLSPSPSLFCFFTSLHFSLISLFSFPLFFLSLYFFFLSFFPDPPSFSFVLSNLFFWSSFLLFLLFFAFVCVCVCVYPVCMCVRHDDLAIPCVSANDNVKHTKSNLRYDNKINKMKQI